MHLTFLITVFYFSVVFYRFVSKTDLGMQMKSTNKGTEVSV